ncbi:protein-disulfide reductase DsbD family protein [Aequorivita vladivostokensis]|uniref:Thiol:disulfide interchange protein DsbD n=1 Tax=Aequorivita vladivostokensis TaxID=171194 RepID=A0ABR5DI62_9FLAO|nr:cytochrome c biogenesis protein CcdA [Aequorivita vladivostokensis]MAO48258.1 thiol:disulfide interchange protein [Aequorivita sp.]KJJ38458.1 thiol:disulfide interchange protein DsbD [Aequorivita vladivostokensis]MBF29841.1 thiol:disulfide interchange protein [Aequorivita sp.]HAV53625.1 thiol:disulfide interchange protein [Aequorivita sp.]HBL79127.1 thiol:disulfide interchange protein [Aequorivita sp.]|tara:strand:- start:17453 stop:19519 length:2067 start_codon:yes stop_codon:yes gene_type:complete
MKKIFLFLLLATVSLASVQAQILDPVTWSTSVKKISETEYDLIAKATIEDKWHLYSQEVPPDGPLPTLFTFEENAAYKGIGKVQESQGITEHDPVFDMVITFFANTATFTKRIKLTGDKGTTVKGEVEFMVCDDTRCLPPSYVDLVFQIPAPQKTEAAVTPENGDNTEITEETLGLAKADTVLTETTEVVKDSVQSVSDASKTALEQNKKQEKKGLWTIFIVAFLFGFTALLTPCVFPMIPMTVSFFTKQSKSRAKGIKNAIIYGIAIIVIYVFLGAIVTGIFGADALNAFSTNVWFNVIFFLLILFFAFSFLGAYEITLPSSWATKADKQADRGGMIGIFFMALALAIVSFSCTGPIIGYLLVEAASKGGIAPFVGMFGFSLALALPFALFAAFPGWMNSLPKSGGWLNTVKVFLGFLELALAFKFLSNADLVLQLHWLEREVFIAIWIAIFGALALYLFGKIQLPHDSPLTHISVGRLSLGLLVLSFTIYMIPGLWGAPLKLISGFPPAMNYSESPYGVGFTKLGGGGSASANEFPEGAYLGPHDIISFHDYETGLAYAKKIGKPVLIDFTGHACVNCRKMEERVWSEPKILNLLKEDIVLISLYVDDKRPLPEGEEVISEISGKKLRYIGQKWSEFQILRYEANAQPFYVLMDHNEENLIEPVGYTPDIDEYYAWLQKGVDAFKK